MTTLKLALLGLIILFIISLTLLPSWYSIVMGLLIGVFISVWQITIDYKKRRERKWNIKKK